MLYSYMMVNKTEKPKTPRRRTKSLVKNEFTQLAKVDRTYSPDQLDFIRRVLAPTLNTDELRLFIYRAQKLGLNPLNGEISAHVRTGKHGRQLVIIIGKDGKARKAMQTGLVEWATVEAIYTKEIETEKEGTALKRVPPWEGGKLWGAVAEVKRKGIERPFRVILPLEEYQTGQLYSQLKSTMIKKTALSQAYTMAFPDLFAGVYVEEELPTIMNKPTAVPLITDGDQPATDAQIQTITSLGGAVHGGMTKQEAAEAIKSLSQHK